MTKAGIETSDLLAEYYSNLANNQRTVYELKEFNRSMDRFTVLGAGNVPQLTDVQLATISYYNQLNDCNLVRAIIVNKTSEEIERRTRDLSAAARQPEIQRLTPPAFASNTETEKGRAAARCTILAFQQRADLAKKISKYFNSFKELADYDFAGEVKEAANDLTDSFASLVPFPYGRAVAASDIVGEIGADIAKAKQKKEVVRQTQIAVEILKKVRNLFDAEKPVYDEVNGLLVLESSKAAKHLVETDMIQIWRILDVVPDTLGLKVINDKWNGPLPAAKVIAAADSEQVKSEKELFNQRREAFLESFLKLIEARQMRIVGSLDDGGSSLQAALAKMQNILNEYINNSKQVSTAEVASALERAKFYFDEFKELKKQIKSTEEVQNSGVK